MTYLTPEQRARQAIDKQLEACGWIVQDYATVNLYAADGIAVREYPTSDGVADYVLFVDRKPVGIIEAKKEEEGYRISDVEAQSGRYARSQLKYLQNDPLPFVYESTGILTRFTDFRDPKPRAREVFTFFRPETFREWLRKPQSLRRRLHNLPDLPTEGLRECQINAITNLEASFKNNYPRALVQMATGAGKTYTAITAIYRLLKYADAKRILFLVDTKNLGEQAEQEFMAYLPNDDNRMFVELYNVQRLKSGYIATDSQVCISTIQRMYSILKGEELTEDTEKENPAETRWERREPVPVAYNPQIPIEFFDFIVIDECHRSIYNLWKQVLEYFDAFLIGVTATPDKRTYGFFNKNVVSEYTHERAVIDGVNVGYDVYLIETKVTQKGARVEKKQYVEKREKLTRKKRWEQLDEDLEYTGAQLDRDVVNPDQIRTIIRAYRDNLPEIFPHREEVPKTLIFAKTDSHADDIIQIVREEFGEGNEFCKKVTYNATEDPKSILNQFRNAYYPRIAVTVDMIATGTDVKPLECLIFMRDVRSKNYFEQMKGRGTRTISLDDLQRVTPSAHNVKDHFVIVDAVGVTTSVKTDSRPLEQKPSVSLKDLLKAVAVGASDEDLFTSLAGRLARLDRQMTSREKEKLMELSGGKSLPQAAAALLEAYDPDVLNGRAMEKFGLSREDGVEPTAEQIKEVQVPLIQEAARFFTPEINEYIENVRKVHEQLLDNITPDELIKAEWRQDSKDNAEKLVQDFKAYLEEHKDEITALQVFYNLPYQRRSLSYKMVKELLEKIKADRPMLAPANLWHAYEVLDKQKIPTPRNELTTLVAVIRRVLDMDKVLTPYDKIVDRNFQEWVFKKQAGPVKFTQEQMKWLHMIKDHIATSFHLESEDLDYDPFNREGGLGRMWQLFGDQTDTIIQELNEGLVA